MNRFSIHTLYLCVILAALLSPRIASAFPADSYAPASVLAEGRWVKVSVSESGIHFIPASSLREWGFSSPEKVSVYGYGGRRLPDRLSLSSYVDDLPRLQIRRSAEGIWFYASGPETWTRTSAGNFYHSLNPFSSFGFYFLSDCEADSSGPSVPVEGFDAPSPDPQTTFTERLFHETDRISPGQTGHRLVGEDFRITREKTLHFDLPGRVEDSPLWLRASFVAASSGRSTVTYSANGLPLPQSATLSAVSSHLHATDATITAPFEMSGDKLSLGILFATQGVTTLAALDAVSVNYCRRIGLTGGYLHFTAGNSSVVLSGGRETTTVWDVTDPLHIHALKTVASPGGIAWKNTYSGQRLYAAWNDGAALPVPRFVATVRNQNLHGVQESPDMVIISPRDWLGEATRLAEFHRSGAEPLEVLVVCQDDIFNEFASGAPDVNALRRFLKMLYDRGNESGRPLRYALLFGRATFDNRCLTAEMQALGEPFIPTWQTDDGLSVTSSFTTDDILAMLEDDSGANLASSTLSIAVGRAPLHNLSDARTFVDKVIEYSRTPSAPADWKNHVVMMADNGDSGVFMKDSERQYANMLASSPDLFFSKVYIDAFDVIGGECEGGRKRLHRLLDEGFLWLNYIGHGDRDILSEENVFTTHDITHMSNRRWPLLFGATCSFAMHDGTSQSGAETLLLTPRAGTIASIAPTRQAMISHNGTIAAAFGAEAFRRDDRGLFPTIGEICRRAKNRLLTSSSSDANRQKLYYVLLGDPALRLALPASKAVLEEIDGTAVTDENQCTVMARQRPRFSGTVCDAAGNILDDFNGTVTLSLFDAEQSTTSKGAPTGGANPTPGEPVTFDEHGERLYFGRDSVRNGRFSVAIPIPAEIAHNFRPATLNMYALADDGREASGCNRSFYLYGFDDSALPDTVAPVIEYACLNHPSFSPHEPVNESPVFIARVTDDTAINLSTAGIGHQMSLRIDDNRSFNDVALYFTPDPDGSPSGTVAYPLPVLSQGAHTLTFRVWDTSGNSTSETIDFIVSNAAGPRIFDISVDANPATTEANFRIIHNRPDAMLRVTLDVYNLLGHRVWTTSLTERSDLLGAVPIKWNLTDMSGRRLPRGIYIYRATIIADGRHTDSAARRIAVTSP